MAAGGRNEFDVQVARGHPSKGGKGGGGGAQLTELGKDVLARYRRMQAATAEAIDEDLQALRRVLSAKRATTTADAARD